MNRWIKTSNYVYNKTIACIDKGHKINFMDLRDKLVTQRTKKYNEEYKNCMELIRSLNKQIKSNSDPTLKESLKIQQDTIKNLKYTNNNQVNKWECETPKEVRAGAINDICKAYKVGFKNLKMGNINHFKITFKKINKCSKSFLLPSNFINNSDGIIKIAPQFFKENHKFYMGKKTFKKHKSLEIKHDCRIIKKANKYWIAIPIPTILKEKTKPLMYCGIDPGVRTFLTTLSSDGVNEYTQNKVLLKKLNKKIDILNSISNKKKCKYKIEERKENIINELHWKCINDILKKNDYIFYGDIKSHDIVRKGNNKFLNRNINDLKFYKFKERLMYKANVLNKKVYLINEAYTTKTCSSCGFLNNVEIKEIYKCMNTNCNRTLLRDVSAAKNILMKGIINYL